MNGLHIPVTGGFIADASSLERLDLGSFQGRAIASNIGLEIPFNPPARVGALAQFRVYPSELLTAVDNVAKTSDIAKLLLTLKAPDGSIIVNNYPLLRFAGQGPVDARIAFAPTTIVDWEQSFILPVETMTKVIYFEPVFY